jgi:hypothetical protein
VLFREDWKVDFSMLPVAAAQARPPDAGAVLADGVCLDLQSVRSYGFMGVCGLLSVVDQWRLGSRPAASCPRKA